jgi:hypothetical protein
MKRRIAHSLRTPVVAVLATALAWGCSDQVDPTSSLESPIVPTVLQRDLAMVIEVQERHTPQLMRVANVVGTAVSLGSDGEPVVTVLAKNTSEIGVPKQLEGVPVEVMLTGEFYAQPPVAQAKPTCGKKNLPPCPPEPPNLPPTSRFPRPVPLGVSTGHPDITAGTIGARVMNGSGSLFALSNNHVYANENLASNGDAVIQPGTFDGGSSPADDIGTLAAYEPLIFGGGGCPNTIDAAIASTTAADVGNATHPDGYGTPKSQTIAPALNMRVKKYGRTTRFTQGTVAAINATVNVGYDSGVACFTGQFVITPGSFSAGGDSGSLIVVNGKGRSRADNNKPVGLLFAGSATSTIANPINAVLSEFGVTIDGN